jgi:hypothetical protein
MTACRPCLNHAPPENCRGFCTAPFPAISGCEVAHSAVSEIRLSFKRALAFADPFDPDLKIVNGLGADGFSGTTPLNPDLRIVNDFGSDEFSGRTGLFEPDSRGRSSTISSETSCRIATPMSEGWPHRFFANS